MALLCRKHNYLYIHIFKTGGNAVRKALHGCTLTCGAQAPVSGYGVHVVASDLKAVIGQYYWDSFFKFTFIRNPLDWMISLYWYCRNARNHFLSDYAQADFASWVAFYIEFSKKNPRIIGANKTVSQFEHISENGKPIVDFIGRQEYFERDMNIIRNKLGMNILPIEKVNVGFYDKRQSKYDSATQKLMLTNYADDFELWQKVEKYGNFTADFK